MATFTGTAADETISPDLVSATVVRIPAGAFPSEADDTLRGEAGNDTLVGAGGNDLLAGGAGADELHGDAIGSVFTGFGKYYQLIPTDMGFADALSTALATTLNGIAGQLVTIHSAAENAFVSTTITDGHQFWLGASDAVNEGEWYWLDGSTPVEHFWSTSSGAVDGLYANWTTAEPNNFENEDAAVGNWQNWGNPAPTWNDVTATNTQSDWQTAYIVVEWTQSEVGDIGAGVGTDTADYSTSGSGVTVDLAAGTGSGGDAEGDRLFSIENVIGSGTADILSGDSGANVLTGLAGDDRLDGGTGSDTMIGGMGDDSYFVDDVGDTISELAGGGLDDRIYSSISLALIDNVERLYLTGPADLDGTGNAFDNTIFGNDGDNILNGLGGGDILIGGRGDDTYIVDDDLESVSEQRGNGTDSVRSSITFNLRGYVENLTLTNTADAGGVGNTLDNVMTGNDGDNAFRGRDGDDTLVGGRGNDILRGNAGADTFVFAAASGIDNIRDLTPGEGDTIDLSALSLGVVGGGGIVISQAGLHALIDLGGGNSVIVENTTATDTAFLSHIVW